MNVKTYLKNGIWEIILLAVMTTTVALSLFRGFYIPDSQAKAYVPTLIFSLVIALLLYLAFYSKKTIRIGIVVFIAVVVVFLIAASRTGTPVFKDTSSNHALYYVIEVLTGLGVFLGTRKKVPSIITFAIGSLAVGLIEYLYDTHLVPCLVIYLAAGLCMIIYRNYADSVVTAKTRRYALGSMAVMAVLICVISTAVGSGVFYAVVRPINPPARTVKLITKHMALQVVKKTGIADTQKQQTPKQQKTEKKNSGSQQNKKDKTSPSNKNTRIREKNNRQMNAVKYKMPLSARVILIIVIIAAVIALFIIKRMLRRRWYESTAAKDGIPQVIDFYQFYLRDFSRMGIKKNPQETPYEFASRAQALLRQFRTSNTDFAKLTEIYMDAGYGGIEPDAAQKQAFRNFYQSFYENSRRFLGTFKYLLKFFRL